MNALFHCNDRLREAFYQTQVGLIATTARFGRVAAGAEIEVIHTPVGAPKANAVCERFIGSVRFELLDHILILSERRLRHKVAAYVRYFNHARPHQGINGQIPIPASPPPPIIPPLSQSTPANPDSGWLAP